MKSIDNNFTLITNVFYRVAIVTFIILCVPFIAMQFTHEVNWDKNDFIIMGALLFSMGSLFVLISRKMPRKRLLIGSIFIAIFLCIWAELAVGLVTGLVS